MSSAPADQFVRVRCPDCDASLKLKGAVRPGKRIKCPKCQGEIIIPDNSVQPAAALAPAHAQAAAPTPKKREQAAAEDDWLDDLGNLDDTAVNLGETAILPPRVGAQKPRKSDSTTIETRKPRKTSRRTDGSGRLALGGFGSHLLAACGGMIGGAIGAAVWAGIIALTEYEIGWIAWGVGLLAGLGVRLGSGEEDGPLLGVLAVLIAFGSIYLGKAGGIYFIAANMGLIQLGNNPIGLAIGCLVLVPVFMSFWDILWFGLAGFTAFKIGSGMDSGD